MTVPAKGAHQADWEAVTLLLSADLTRVAAVTYSQHGGWYTRVAGRNGFEVRRSADRDLAWAACWPLYGHRGVWLLSCSSARV